MMSSTDAGNLAQTDFDLWDEKLSDPLNLTYTFLGAYPSYYKTSILDLTPGKINILGDFSIDPAVTEFIPAQKTETVDLLSSTGGAYRASFSDVSNIVFTEVSQTGNGVLQSGDITFSKANLITGGDELGFEYSQNNALGQLDKSGIVIDAQNAEFVNGLDAGELGLHTILHEIGHALGLEHPWAKTADELSPHLSYNPYGAMISVGNAVSGSTVYASGLQLLDIAALQDTYGTVNTATRAGDTVYALGQGLGFSGAAATNAFLYTIWDGGGNDTISASGYADGVEIDLREGHFSSIGVEGNGIFSANGNSIILRRTV